MSINVSKNKREELLQKLLIIKSSIQKMSNDVNSTQLLNYIGDLENELFKEKFGLIFEEHKEEIDIKLENNLPIFIEDRNYYIKPKNGVVNFLIEGDNLASLNLIKRTHKNKIEIIYIDPPYNTGNNDFTYDDRFVDSNDGYRHSKWLSFMKKRLDIAKSLLTPNGVIFISIGDNEQATLKLLCDSIFGEDNFIANVPRVAKKTSDKGTYFKPTKDYILVYAKSKNKLGGFGIPKVDDISKYKFEDKRGKYKKNGASLYQPSLDSRPNQRYWIECPDGSFVIPPGTIFPDIIQDASYIKPLSNNDKVWRWSWPTYLANKDKLIFCKSTKSPLIDENGNKAKWNIYDKVYLDSLESATNLPEDIIYDFKNSAATKRILDLGISFSFSKPYELIQYLIQITQKNKNITILDFFAGSGTTGDAVMKLNQLDGGKRNFILCTNNENNICREVTYERIKRVIQKEDYNEGLKYYKIDFIEINDSMYYEYADKLLEYTKELVELENSIDISSCNDIKIALSDEELECIFNVSNIESLNTIYVGHDVLVTNEQEELLEKLKINIKRIPNYYFNELRGL